MSRRGCAPKLAPFSSAPTPSQALEEEAGGWIVADGVLPEELDALCMENQAN